MGHHLILGKTTDFITGSTIIDTDDERIRQMLARFLVHKKGYEKIARLEVEYLVSLYDKRIT